MTDPLQAHPEPEPEQGRRLTRSLVSTHPPLVLHLSSARPPPLLKPPTLRRLAAHMATRWPLGRRRRALATSRNANTN